MQLNRLKMRGSRLSNRIISKMTLTLAVVRSMIKTVPSNLGNNYETVKVKRD